jgi:hypothetical protein
MIGGLDGVTIDGSGQVATLTSLSVTDSTFVGQSVSGLMIGLEKDGSDLRNLVVDGVVFDQSASAGKAIKPNNDGTNQYQGIRAYGFDGDATLSDITVMGAAGGVTTNAAQYGILLQGASTNNMGPTGIYKDGPTMGNVTLENIDVVGGFAKNAVAIYNYANIDGLQGAEGALDLSGATAGWVTVLNVDGVLASYDASKWGVELGDKTAALQGESTLQSGNLGSTITGTADNDIINSKGGNDTLIGGAGNDALMGGAGSDTAVITVDASGAVFARSSGGLTVTAASGTDTLSGVEFVSAGATTYVVVEAFGSTAAAIAAAPSGGVLVQAGPLAVSLTDASAALAKGLSFYG